MSPPPRRAGVARHWLPLLHSGAEVMNGETLIQAVLSDRPSEDTDPRLLKEVGDLVFDDNLEKFQKMRKCPDE